MRAARTRVFGVHLGDDLAPTALVLPEWESELGLTRRHVGATRMGACGTRAAIGTQEEPGGSMPKIELDHIVIAATRLGEGIDYAEGLFGVRVPLGGKHPIMNTHNAVMQLGHGCYLEIIAADPEAGAAERPRWFALDDLQMRQRLDADGPFLINWVARTTDIATTAQRSRVDIGKVETMSRGALRWQIGIRPDGSMRWGGLFPTVIEWPPGPHPLERMADLGVRLESLTLRSGSPGNLAGDLASIGADKLVEIRPTKRGHQPMEAVLVTPKGARVMLTGGGTPHGADRCAA